MEKRPEFYVMYKEFNSGKVERYDVLKGLFNNILIDNNIINKKTFVVWDDDYNQVPIATKEQLYKFIDDRFKYMYWSKCEWEFLVVDWPYREYDIVATDNKGKAHNTSDGLINESRPEKIDVYNQLEPNMPIIVDVVWNYIKNFIK